MLGESITSRDVMDLYHVLLNVSTNDTNFNIVLDDILTNSKTDHRKAFADMLRVSYGAMKNEKSV